MIGMNKRGTQWLWGSTGLLIGAFFITARLAMMKLSPSWVLPLEMRTSPQHATFVRASITVTEFYRFIEDPPRDWRPRHALSCRNWRRDRRSIYMDRWTSDRRLLLWIFIAGLKARKSCRQIGRCLLMQYFRRCSILSINLKTIDVVPSRKVHYVVAYALFVNDIALFNPVSAFLLHGSGSPLGSQTRSSICCHVFSLHQKLLKSRHSRSLQHKSKLLRKTSGGQFKCSIIANRPWRRQSHSKNLQSRLLHSAAVLYVASQTASVFATNLTQPTPVNQTARSYLHLPIDVDQGPL